jgi:hypothetical protein
MSVSDYSRAALEAIAEQVLSRRAELLATMAASIAAGLTSKPLAEDCEGKHDLNWVAGTAVDIARRILAEVEGKP